MAEFISKINLGGKLYNIKDSSVDSSIAAAKAAIIGDASADFETLGKIQSQVQSKVSEVNGSDTVAVSSGTTPTVSVRISEIAGNIIEAESDGIYATVPAAAEYSISKDTTSSDYAAVYHLTKDGVSVGEAINIPKDYLVKSAKVVTGTFDASGNFTPDATQPGPGPDKAIDFVVNVKEGTGADEHIYLNVKDLVKDYTAGAGIEISANNVVSAKVADETDNAVDTYATNKNFLKINDSSALEVKGVDTDSTIFTENITVAGGPLSSLTSNWPTDWKDESGNCIIPADKSVQEIFSGLFLKKTAGTLSNVTYTWNPVYASAPSAGLGATGNVEIGTELTVTAATVAGLSGNTSTATATANPGYYEGDTYHSGNYSQSVAGTCNDDNLAYTATFGSTSVVNGDKVTVVAGTNTLTVTQSGSVASVGDLTATTLYGAYNTKEKNASVSKSVEAKSYDGKNIAAKSATASVTGVYKYYYGYIAYDPTSYVGKVTSVDSLYSKSSAFLSTSYGASIASMESVSGHSSLVVLIPSVAKISASKNSLGSDNLNTWEKVDSISYTCGNTTTTYDVWVASSSASILYKEITIAKA